MASGAAGLKLLLIRDAFGHDGGATRFLALPGTLRRRGGAPRIVSGPGPLDELEAAAGEVGLVDWARCARVPLGGGVRRRRWRPIGVARYRPTRFRSTTNTSVSFGPMAGGDP